MARLLAEQVDLTEGEDIPKEQLKEMISRAEMTLLAAAEAAAAAEAHAAAEADRLRAAAQQDEEELDDTVSIDDLASPTGEVLPPSDRNIWFFKTKSTNPPFTGL